MKWRTCRAGRLLSRVCAGREKRRCRARSGGWAGEDVGGKARGASRRGRRGDKEGGMARGEGAGAI